MTHRPDNGFGAGAAEQIAAWLVREATTRPFQRGDAIWLDAEGAPERSRLDELAERLRAGGLSAPARRLEHLLVPVGHVSVVIVGDSVELRVLEDREHRAGAGDGLAHAGGEVGLMPDHRSHGFPYQEVERHDALKAGIHAGEQAEAGQERTALGRFAKGASTPQRKGGKARKNRTKLSHDIVALPVSETLKKRARFMRRRTCAELARTHGGGECGIVASVLVKLATEDLALREEAMAAGEVDTARKLGESARMHLLYARESVVKDAEARSTRRNHVADIQARILSTGDDP